MGGHQAALGIGQGTQGQAEREFVAVAQVGRMLHDLGQRQLISTQILEHRRVGGVEGEKPVAQGLEERESLEVGKCGDKHVTALELHGVELLDFAGYTRLVKPVLPLRIGLNVTQVNDLGVFVLELVDDVGPHLHDVGNQVVSHAMLHILGITGTGQLHLNAPHVVFEIRHVKHGGNPGVHGARR